MSATDYRRRCPHGHTNLRKLQPDNPVSTAAADWRCEGCRVSPKIVSCHYQSREVENQKLGERKLVMGYVWSPSHDEDDPTPGGESR